MTDLFSSHTATIKGLGGAILAQILASVTPVLSVIVLLLTIWNLALEIQRKRKKD